MKKYLSTLKYKHYNTKHAEQQLLSKLRFKKQKRLERRQFQNIARHYPIPSIKKNKHKYWDYNEVIAPSDFSFLYNTEEVISFVNEIVDYHKKRKKVWVRLRDVIHIDYGAIVVLLSIMVQFKSQGIDFNGDKPRNVEANRLLYKSGFLYNLFFRDEERYSIGSEKNFDIHTHAWKDVDAQLGEKIITEASQTVWNEKRRCQGVQRAFIELMQNTNNHAVIGKEGEKHWWLSVHHNKEDKTVTFSFVDFGVGIFTNLNNKPESSKFHNWLKKLTGHFTFKNNAELLKLILEGKLHLTVTGKHFRGKGLPGIAEVQKRNQISNLHIVTNDVRYNVSQDEYKLLMQNFNGTFISWEIGVHNESCKYNNN